MSQVIASKIETFDANGRISLTNANFVFLIAVSAGTCRMRLQREGAFEEFSGLQAGLQVYRTKGWQWATLDNGTPGATVTLFYGYASARDDITLFNQQIATIAGTVGVALIPSGAFTDTADTAQAINTQTVIAANLARRRITIGVLASSAENVRVSGAGGAGRGIQIQPGTFVEFDTTAALTVRNTNDNASGLVATWYAEEE
jgi:hypothetical protein